MSYSKEPQPLPPGDSDLSAAPMPELDSAALNVLTRNALKQQVYFGRGLELSDTDRFQLELVATSAETILEPNYKDPNWAAFQALVNEGEHKGLLLSIASHDGTNVPNWCIDGGPEAAVKKIKTDAGRAAIQVPTGVFNLYHWTNTIRAVRRCAATSSEILYGTPTKSLGRDLYGLAHLIGKPDSDDRSLPTLN